MQMNGWAAVKHTISLERREFYQRWQKSGEVRSEATLPMVMKLQYTD